MTRDELSLIAGIHRLAVVDRQASARVARLLCIGEMEARAVIGLASGARSSRGSLQVELEMSAGGAAALAERLIHDRLVDSEPDPDRPRAARLRLSAGAQLELEAALDVFAGSSGDIAARMPAAERRAVVACLLAVSRSA